MDGRASRRLRPQLFHICLFATLLVAVPGCSALRGTGASPDPSKTPIPTAIPAPTDTPTSAPASAPAIDYPTGATDVILRVEWGGGFVQPQTIVTQAPQFTLYGDGTAVFRALPNHIAGSFSQPYPPFLTGHMSGDAIQELLHYALHEGGLADARTSYDFPGVADAGTTTFWIDAGGVDKTVAVYALIETDNGPDQADRDKLLALEDRITNFETEARNGGVEHVSDYDPETYKVVLFDDTMGSPTDGADVIEWPWPDIKPSDFVALDEYAWKVLNMSKDDVAKLTDVPNGGQNSIWVIQPDGSQVNFALRPLLPDEVSTPEHPTATD